jgi:hypothetical protein
MGFTGFESAEGILHEMIKGFYNQITKEPPPLYAKLMPKSDKVEGSEVVFSAQLENPQGFGSRRTASQTLPAAVPGKYRELRVGTGRCYLVLEFDDKMIKAVEASKTGRTRFINYVENELKGGKTTMKEDLGRQVYGDGKGILSACGTTGASLTVQLASTANMEYFVEGMHIDLVVSATGAFIANGNDRTIESVDVANRRIVLDSAGGVVTTDDTMGATRQGSYNAELTGLASIVSDTADIYGVTTALERRWKAHVKSSFGAFAVEKLSKEIMAAKVKSGKFINTIVTNPDLLGQYWYQLTGTKRFDYAQAPQPVKKLGAGYHELSITVEGREMNWMSDPDCPAGKIYGLDMDHMEIQHLGDPEWMDVKGEILLPQTSGSGATPTYKAVLAYYPQIICTKRNSQMVCEGVTDISGW